MRPPFDQLLIGAHTSAAGGVFNALIEGREIGATTIQLFTSNQRRWESKPLQQEVIDRWNAVLKETALREIMSHDSYLINLGAPDPLVLQKSRNAFQEELTRCLQLGISYLNFHPGAALTEDPELCLNRICESLIGMKALTDKGSTVLLLETTAGQGSSVGDVFEHLAYIIERTKMHVPIGVCMDTCHLFAAGYDVRDKVAWDQTLKQFDEIVGLKYLRAFHLNDSLKGLGSHVDRHQALGKGQIGLECFKFLMTDPRTSRLPKYLETPGGPPLWKEEIALLKEFGESCT